MLKWQEAIMLQPILHIYKHLSCSNSIINLQYCVSRIYFPGYGMFLKVANEKNSVIGLQRLVNKIFVHKFH